MATYQNLSNFDGLKVGDIIEYTYSGAPFPVVLAKGTYKLKCYGASGGNGGQGGYAEGVFQNMSPDISIFIRVGGTGGTSGTGGFNGGAGVATGSSGRGGGASDIRFEIDSLYHRLIIAGGGGGKGHATSVGGAGGGLLGEDGAGSGSYGEAGGGTQVAGGTKSSTTQYASYSGEFGQGGTGYGNSGGGGGGGWYGGGGAVHGGGGGGSGFVWEGQSLTLPAGQTWELTSNEILTETILEQGVNTGNGLVVIEIIKMPITYLLATDGTDTYAFADPEWEVVIEDEYEPDVQAFLDYGVFDIPSFDGLPADCHLLVYDPEQDNKEFVLNIESNPPEQVITMKSGIILPFAVTADQPMLTKTTNSGGTAEITGWKQAGNRVNVEITMTKPDMSATASVLEIKVPFTKGTSAGGSSESAYDMAVAGGYTGTLEEFKIDLANIEGLSNIETAYEMAVAGGYMGTLEEFKVDLASIEGLTDAIATIVGE